MCLDAASSVGKTTIARHLQAVLAEPYMLTGLDHFLFTIDDRFRVYEPDSSDSFTWALASTDSNTVLAETGPMKYHALSPPRVW